MANRMLYEVRRAIECYLSPYFGLLTVKVIDCPNLCRKPFNFSRSGISGDSTIASLGSLDYLLPAADPKRLYDLMHTAQASRLVQGMIIGGGLGPFQTYNRPCEVAADITFTTRGLESNHSLVGFGDVESESSKFCRATNSYIASMGQFFVTEAKPGKVIQIEAKDRRGGQNIFDMIQRALYEEYNGEELPMGVGGVFCLQNSSAKVSLLNEVPSETYHTFPCVRKYKTSFSIEGPIIGAGTIVSHDPTTLGYMMKSFYCWNTARTLMGQFEEDDDPANACFQIYLTVATQIYRHDKPVYRV
ncbi:unnamed protein product [Hymenolepis diminuta]|uniref:DUF1907 domain-containing protein n=2 Tax=Hymenolepis diminuta TaxID=6216 RepID=A0A564XY28_HYMDI|nr:unnamed protein product [Hymenolepis diminuta]